MITFDVLLTFADGDGGWTKLYRQPNRELQLARVTALLVVYPDAEVVGDFEAGEHQFGMISYGNAIITLRAHATLRSPDYQAPEPTPTEGQEQAP